MADLDPDVAVWVGIPGRYGEYADYSPAGQDAQLAAGNAVIAELEAATPVDSVDEVTKTDLLAELRLERRVSRGQAARARRQRDRVARPVHPRHLRPDADRDRERLGDDR